MQRTELSLFAQEFQRVLAPLAAELANTCARLSTAAEDAALPFAAADLERGLAGVARELADVIQRVASERASVFVFGPVKAGKSTLLAALAGAHASDVSSLPTYPCVLRARHAAEAAVALVRFDGTMESLVDPAALRLVLQRAHAELAAEVRAVVARDEAFDPARHLQSAVRRIERALPSELLERTAVELVECPPVHGPLFASYGALLIGEPDAARAAVFVVRAAQLADDAVFERVAELLAVFERLLLVVNLDEKSRELTRAGEFAPGLEREDPARLVEALERLTSSAALAAAIRSGRVSVLTLDLLEAARARLRGEEEGTSGAGRRTRFADLLTDLGVLLDGHEALSALVTSAERRAQELLEEARELSALPGLGELGPRLGVLETERAAGERQKLALTRLAARERALWQAEEFFCDVRLHLETTLATRARELGTELALPLATALEDWFASGASLQALLDEALAPRLAAATAELARAGERELREELRKPPAAERLSVAARRDLAEARVELTELLAPLTAAFAPLSAELAAHPALARALDVEAIPVKPKIGQRLAFRGEARVRHALFGPPEVPARALSAEEKAKRLGREALAVMKRSAAERAVATLGEQARLLARSLHEAWSAAFTRALEAHVQRELERRVEPARVLAERVIDLAALEHALGALEQASAAAGAGLLELGERFQPAGTLRPAPRAEPPPRAQPERREFEGLPALE